MLTQCLANESLSPSFLSPLDLSRLGRALGRGAGIGGFCSPRLRAWFTVSLMNLFDLSGEVAVVIGATGSLGGAMAQALGQAGAAVAVVGRNVERGQACVESLEQQGIRAAFFAADAMSRDDLRRVESEVESQLGVPSVLVNAAGGNDPKATVTADLPFESIGLDAWRGTFDLNLVGGVLLPCQTFGPGFCARRRGTVINVASVSAHIPLSRVVSYSAAKAAVLSLTQFLSREWAPSGVRVNSITPGFFPAEQNRRLLFNEDGSPTARAQAILNHTPMARFGAAQELGGAVVFLASSRAAGFVTGTDLRVDGGFLSQTL